MIYDIVAYLNSQIEIDNSVLHGVAYPVIRENEHQPVTFIDTYSGQYRFAGFDDDHALISYHKVNGISTSVKGTGFGDKESSHLTTTYNCTLHIYYNRMLIARPPDEVYLFFLANLPTKFELGEIKVTVSLKDVRLDIHQLFSEEYKNNQKVLAPEQVLMAINYSIESTYTNGCFDTVFPNNTLN